MSIVRDNIEELRTINDASTIHGYDENELAKASYNAIINPLDENVIINQRVAGAVAGITQGYPCDRWSLVAYLDGGSTNAYGEIVQNDNKYSLELRGGISGDTGGGYFGVRQKIDNVRKFASQSCVLSFDIESDVDGQALVHLKQYFGVGGSADVVAHNDYINVSTTKTRVSINVDIPSIVGKTIGDGSCLHLQILKYAGASSFTGKAVNISGDVRISNVKFGYNDIYVPIDEANELTECMRYFRTTYSGVSEGTLTLAGILTKKNSASYTGTEVIQIDHEGMRSVPSITVYDSVGNVGKCSLYVSVSGTYITDQKLTRSSAYDSKDRTFYYTDTTTTKYGCLFHAVISSEL